MTSPTALITRGDELDVLVVGGGLAGLGGALMLSRARRSVLVVDAGHPRNEPAAHTHGYLTRDGAAPLELLRLGREEIRGYGNEIVTGEVTGIDRLSEGHFRVTLADGSSHLARRVLVTTGLVDELPDVPGLRERWGNDVVHCPYCFGWEIRDEPMGLLGGAAHSVGQALMWRQWTNDLTILVPTGSTLSEEQREQLTARDIRIVEGDASGLDVVDDQLTGVRLESGEVVALRVLIISPRFVARGGVLADLGVTTEPHPLGIGSQVLADPTGRTSEPGIWVAGNVTDVSAGIMQATASGVLAAAAINGDLVQDDTSLAVAAARIR
jgi:thioredoxin reductase (NADPH)